MARKKNTFSPQEAQDIKGQLEMFGAAVLDGDAADWTAVDTFHLGELVRALVAADAGIMLRAAEQRTSLGVGLFLGLGKRWVTCRDQRELLDTLEAALEACERLAGLREAPKPTKKAKKAQKAT